MIQNIILHEVKNNKFKIKDTLLKNEAKTNIIN